MAGLNIAVQRTARLSAVGRILSGVAALLLAAGVAGCAVALTGVQLPPVALAAGAAGMTIAVAGGCLLAGRGRPERLFYLIAALALVVASAVLSGPVLEGGAQFANALIMRVGERTQLYSMPFQAGGDAQLALFCAVAGMALGLGASLLAQRGMGMAAMAVLLCALAGVVAGWVPAGWWAVLLGLGAMGCACASTTLSNQAFSRSSYAWALASALAVCLVVGAGVAAGTQGRAVDVSGPQDALARVAWGMRYGNAQFAMPEGQVDGLGPLAASDQPAMEVTTDQPTFEYLRGFVGERYANGAWQPLDGATVMANRDMLYWLDGDRFQAASQVGDVASLVGFYGGTPATLSQSLRSVRGPYAYLPYGYTAGSDAQPTTDLAQMRRDTQTAQQLEYDASIVRKAYLLQDELGSLQDSAAEAYRRGATVDGTVGAENSEVGSGAWAARARTYLDDARAYRNFAEEAYLQVPDELTSAFEHLYGPAPELTCEQAKIQVMALMEDTVRYDAEARQDNGSEDVVKYFLSESQTGYSVHYATAATLLMRYYGVPARYVEGYVLNTDELDAQAAAGEGEGRAEGESGADADASASAANVANGADAEKAPFLGTYTLTEKQAHAWVEYYLDGVGWVPFDVTPGWSDASYYEATDNTQTVEESMNWSVGESKQDEVWTPPEDQAVDSDEDEDEANVLGGVDLTWLHWPWALFGFLLTLLVAFVVRDLLLRSRLKRFLEDRRNGVVPAPEAVGSLFAYLVQLARTCGDVPLVNAPYAAQALALQDAGLCEAPAFARAAAANDRLLFAAAEATDDDVRAVVSCIDEGQASLKRQTTLPQRFWQRHVQCLW